MPNQFLQQLDSETKDRLQLAVERALNEGIPEDTIRGLLEANGEQLFRESFTRRANEFSDPIDTAVGLGLSLIEPNVENLVALPLSFITGPGLGKLAAKGLGSKAVRRLAVKFLMSPPGVGNYAHPRRVLFDAARKEGLEKAFGAAIRIKEEPHFMVSLARAFGFAAPFAATDALAAAVDEDDTNPLTAFGSTLGTFVTLDMILTTALPGIGNKIASGLRRRISEETFRATPFGSTLMRAFDAGYLQGAPSVMQYGQRPVRGALPERATRYARALLPQFGEYDFDSETQAALRKMTERDIEAILAGEGAVTPEARAAVRRMAGRGIDVEDLLTRLTGQADGLNTVGQATSRAMTSIRTGSPRAAAAIDEAVEIAETSGLIGDTPAEQTVVAAIKDTRPATVDERVPGAMTKGETTSAQATSAATPSADNLVTELDASGRPVASAALTSEVDAIVPRSRVTRKDGRTATVSNVERTGGKKPKVKKVWVEWDDGGTGAVLPSEIASVQPALEAEAEAAAVAAAEAPVALTGRAFINTISDEAALGNTVIRVKGLDGSPRDAILLGIGDDAVTVRMPSGKKRVVPYEEVLGPVAEPPTVSLAPTPKVQDLALTDAEGFEADIAAKIFPFRSGRNFGMRVNWADVSRMTTETKTRFPKESLLGRQAVVTKTHVVYPSGTGQNKGIPLPEGTELIVGREEYGFVKGHRKLDYRAYVWRYDPESGAFHIVHYGNVEHLKAAGVEIADTPFGGTSEASRNALLEIISREKVTAADVELANSKVFQSVITGKETRLPREEIARVLNDMPDGIPYYNSMIIKRLKARNIRRTSSMAAAPEIRGAERIAREVADTGETRGRGHHDIFVNVQNLEILKTARANVPNPETVAIIDSDLLQLRRLTFIREGMTPRKESARKKHRAMKAKGIRLTEKQRVLDSLINASERGLTEGEAKELARLESTYGTARDLDAALQGTVTDMVAAISEYRPAPLDATGAPVLTTPEILRPDAPGPQLAYANQLVRSTAPDTSAIADSVTAETLRNRFKKIATDEDTALDLMFGLQDFAHARGLDIDVRWNRDYTGQYDKEKLVASVKLTFEGKTVRSYDAEQIPELIDFMAEFAPGDSTIAEKMRMIVRDLNEIRPERC